MAPVEILRKALYWLLMIGCVLLIDHLQIGLVRSALAVWADLMR
ncbi:hypothetical protein [Plastoroseomonas hellenica]|nr:hypothetical protein [Plastoroseomonas hellenica]